MEDIRLFVCLFLLDKNKIRDGTHGPAVNVGMIGIVEQSTVYCNKFVTKNSLKSITLYTLYLL